MLVALLVCLERMGLAKNISKDITEAIRVLQRLNTNYGGQQASRLNPIKQLARRLVGKIPLIFATSGTTGVAGLRMKNQFNENTKVAALLSLLPEMDHNEIVGFHCLKRTEHRFCLLLLRDENDSERIKKRIETTKSLIGSQLGGANELTAQGKSRLARLLSLIFMGDLLSVYVAILHGVDPTPVDIITKLKRELSR